MTTTTRWLHAAGELARDGWDVVVDGTTPGWRHTGLRVGGGEALELPAGAVERVILPLSGEIVVDHGDVRVELRREGTVFDAAPDVLYLGVGVAATVSGPGRFAVAEAAATRAFPPQLLRSPGVPIETRGGGAATRTVRNFGTPGILDAHRLLVCEVVTPAGNWSSYPPHKHDETVAGIETELEEIYYFEAGVMGGAVAPAQADPIGVFAAYGSARGPLDLAGIVRTGDVALVPYGYHGPAGALPGYDLYYLNVMAGPGPERSWLITDDPAHSWVRGTWKG